MKTEQTIDIKVETYCDKVGYLALNRPGTILAVETFYVSDTNFSY